MQSISISDLECDDVRFPTSEESHGSDAMHTDPDYSCAYVTITAKNSETSETLKGFGLAFSLGRGNEVIVSAVNAMRPLIVGRCLSDMATPVEGHSGEGTAMWRALTGDSQARWLGPDNGVWHMACAAVLNALWDMWARVERKPVWRLIADMSPEQIVSLLDFRWIEDALTKNEALAILKENENSKPDRIADLMNNGYPAYTTGAGWLGYSDVMLRKLCREFIADGWTHFKVKVGSDLADDKRRLGIIREEVGDRTIMIDANQKWGVQQAIDWVRALADFRPWFIEEPTHPDDILGHAAIRKALLSTGVKVATGEMCANRIMWKQLFQAGAVDICQIDSCRLAGPNEILTVMLMARKFGVPVIPHAGGVGLCELIQHMSMVDYVIISGKKTILEWVPHLHEHFIAPVTTSAPNYITPTEPGFSTEMHPTSVRDYSWPNGSEWVKRRCLQQKQ
eukprot:983641_1